MKKQDMMIALAASIGAGAATFYTMSKSEQPINTAVENMTPMLNSIAGTEGSGMAGNKAMQGINNASSQNLNNNQQSQNMQ